ncbi:hypothetical protein EDEG_01768 [Edhazardia aedis USNM 41457]|uniref:Uncharacterized protein n=1 Tax=Edhazardia aedis (strain USNM 41457) TaxID=1003232 RepID=J9DRI1_EDHAE|nr:hypothetical protein EDEG_01768 [Edhazardia aedis USNM 41457]|eukprot:EJW03942.1 hypothetical protein EDEG_01768 [Edhazardia aedis USNM 41457]
MTLKKFNIFKKVQKYNDDGDISAVFETSLVLRSSKYPEKSTKLVLNFLKYPKEDAISMFIITVKSKLKQNIYSVFDATLNLQMIDKTDSKIVSGDLYIVYGKIVNKILLVETIKRVNFFEICRGLLEK